MVPEHGAVPLVASLYYTTGDPYAVRMAFHVGTRRAQSSGSSRGTWLPRASQARPERVTFGSGLVRTTASGVLNIALSSPFGQAHFEAPMISIAEFLNRTFGVIAAGQESDFIDVDGELDELLWRACIHFASPKWNSRHQR